MAFRATFIRPQELTEIIDSFGQKLDDWTPAMVRISSDMLAFVRDTVFPTSGEGRWTPLSESTLIRDRYPRKGGGKRQGPLRLSGWMLSRTYRDAAKTNAVIINNAPHAHLHEYGTSRYRVPMYRARDGRKRTSRGEQQARRSAGEQGVSNTPARSFLYIDNGRAETLYPAWVLEFFFSEVE